VEQADIVLTLLIQFKVVEILTKLLLAVVEQDAVHHLLMLQQKEIQVHLILVA
jgi:hypothetical protein